MASLNILHVFRAPVGGLFRHVLDLTREQIARGHRVGLIADLRTGGARADDALRKLEPSLALGLSRVAMYRKPNPGDLAALAHVIRRAKQAEADVVHGHGAKGGAYARLVFGHPRAVRGYTPHGGTLLYSHDTLAGKFYLTTERLLMRRGDLFLFESAFSADMFHRKVGDPRGLVRIVHNGVSPAEFEPVATRPDATDLVFLGELRALKGVDLLIGAIARTHGSGRNVSLTVVGDGPDKEALRAQVERCGLSDAVRFLPAMRARRAMELGRIMVVPSLFESLPYVVLEAAAASKPLISTSVGGIPEIYGSLAGNLVPPNDSAALAQAIVDAIDRPEALAETASKLCRQVQESFSVATMVDGVLDGYAAALETLQKNGRR
ncbi:MAG: glycosyltransferase family 4 protein [Pseudolabrys sp.]